jgi:cation diffusion facilitator family transporter
MHNKTRIARLSIFSNIFLIIIKLIVGIFTGSVSIVSEAIHSAIDLLASIITYFSVDISEAPADKGHPYGHGKFENISGVVEAILIFIAAIGIMIEAVHKIVEHTIIKNLGIGFIVMFISALVNWLVSKQLKKVARETESIALEADATHLRTDVYSALGVGIGLFLIWITGLAYLDPVVAIVVSLFILRGAWILLNNAFSPLVDTAMPEQEIQIIQNLLKNKSLTFHDLKTRRAGHDRFADIHLEMPQDMSLKDVHAICDDVENELSTRIKNLQITIHAEPLEKV